MKTLDMVGTLNVKPKKFKVGDILRYNLSYKEETPTHYFKCLSVNEEWGVVEYNCRGINDTVGIAYVNNTNFIEKIIYFLKYKKHN